MHSAHVRFRTVPLPSQSFGSEFPFPLNHRFRRLYMQSSPRNRAPWHSHRVLIGFLTIMLAATMSFGQGIVTGSMSGAILDQQKAVVPGAKITAKQDGTNVERSTQSNAAGLFSIPNLPVGSYTVSIDAAGFTKSQI